MHGSRQRLIDIGGVRLDNLTHDIASVGRIAHGYDTRLVPDEIAFRQQRKGLPDRTGSVPQRTGQRSQTVFVAKNDTRRIRSAVGIRLNISGKGNPTASGAPRWDVFGHAK